MEASYFTGFDSNESVNLFPLVSKKLEEAGTGRIGLDER